MSVNFSDYQMFLIGIGEEFDNNDKAVFAYNKLAEKLEGKNYFIVTLCMDDQIFESKLNPDRIVNPMGGFSKKQCPDACTHDLYLVSDTVCPHCGKELIYNNFLTENYVEEGYLPMWEKHKKWLVGTLNKSLLVMELGVSMKFPQIIRWPFERISLLNNKAHFIRVNSKLPQLNADLKDKGENSSLNPIEWVELL